MKTVGARLRTVLGMALLALHVLASVWLAVHSVRTPLGNWDIIPYAALTLREPGMSAQEISRMTFADVKAYVDPATYQNMIEGGQVDRAYRVAVYGQPDALVDNLRFYSVKPLYIALSRLAYPITHNSASAGVLVSAIALAALMCIFPFLFRARLLAAGALWLVMMTGAPHLALIASCATPDSLALLFVTCCAVLGARGARWTVLAPLALLAVLSRPDAAFMAVPLLVGLAWLRRAQRPEAVGLLASAAVVFGLFAWLGTLALPWSTLFWHTFVSREPYPSMITYRANVGDYIDTVRRTLPAALTLRPALFLTAGMLLALLPLARSRRILPWQLLAAVAAANMVVHYLIFPIDEYGHERMFLSSYVVLVAAAVLALQDAASWLRQSPLLSAKRPARLSDSVLRP